jgi:hypothetical protein
MKSTISRQAVLMCALSGNVLKKRVGQKTYRIDPHDALERMLNGHDTYELTEMTVVFTGEVDMDSEEIRARLSPRTK